MSLTYCHPCVLISRGIVPIPTPSFRSLVVLLEIYPNFLANPPRSPPRHLLVLISLGERDVFWRSVCKAVPPIRSGIFSIHWIFLLYFLVLFPNRAVARPAWCGSFSSHGRGGDQEVDGEGDRRLCWLFFLLFFVSPSWYGPVAVWGCRSVGALLVTLRLIWQGSHPFLNQLLKTGYPLADHVCQFFWCLGFS